MSNFPLERIRQLVSPVIEGLGYVLYGVEQGGRDGRTLRIVIDKKSGGVSVEDCAYVSSVIDPLIEEAEPLLDHYVLEVSSPGAERELKTIDDYVRFMGRKAKVTYLSNDVEVIVEGRITRVNTDTESIVLTLTRGREIQVDFDEIQRANLVVEI
jgi:ribosome maturation factor RimP